MPKGDGTGPLAQGPFTGGGQGMGRRFGRGRMAGNLSGAGPGGYCICPNPNCGAKVPHQAGKPCYEQKCPKCGSRLVRER